MLNSEIFWTFEKSGLGDRWVQLVGLAQVVVGPMSPVHFNEMVLM